MLYICKMKTTPHDIIIEMLKHYKQIYKINKYQDAKNGKYCIMIYDTQCF